MPLIACQLYSLENDSYAVTQTRFLRRQPQDEGAVSLANASIMSPGRLPLGKATADKQLEPSSATACGPKLDQYHFAEQRWATLAPDRRHYRHRGNITLAETFRSPSSQCVNVFGQPVHRLHAGITVAGQRRIRGLVPLDQYHF